MNEKPFGQIYAIVDPFPEQLGGRVQYIGKHKLGEKETLQESLEKYLDINIRESKRGKGKRPHDVYLRSEIRDCLGNFYEKPKIEPIEVCYSEKELNNREEHWRLFFKGFYPNLLNRAPGGAGGSELGNGRGVPKGPRSEEHIKNLRKPHPSAQGVLNSQWNPDKHTFEIRICECGCGETFECVKSSKKRFIFGHGSRGNRNASGKRSEVARINIRESQNRPETRKLKSELLMGHEVSKTTREKLSVKNKKRFEDPEEHKRTSIAIQNAMRNPEIRERIKQGLFRRFIINLKLQVSDWT